MAHSQDFVLWKLTDINFVVVKLVATNINSKHNLKGIEILITVQFRIEFQSKTIRNDVRNRSSAEPLSFLE